MEIELKLQADPAALPALRRAVATASARRTRLRAVYADTADHRLAGAGLALRLRQEGRRWVQTLKGRGDGVMQRLEHEVPLAGTRGEPALDPARHAGTPAGAKLTEVLAGETPLALFRTDIQRTHRRVKSAGATIEIALDEGRIVAGDAVLPVAEVEFELIDGPAAALPTLVQRWVARHGLWIDVRTKAERGFRLATGQQGVPAVKAEPVLLRPGATPGDAFAAMLQSALAQALPNAAEIASGQGTPEHLHQLRVAIRRLRTALRVFGAWSADPAEAAALEAAWREPFGQLSGARDDDVIAATLLPALQAAGMPPIELARETQSSDPAAVLRDPTFTALVLRTLHLELQPGAADGDLVAEATAVLRRLHKRLARDAKAFADAPVEEQHRIRKRAKRLRYAAEFVQGALDGKPLRELLAALRAAADALGECNDASVAQARFQALVETEPRAWFALGWLAARRDRLVRRASKALKAVAQARRWR